MIRKIASGNTADVFDLGDGKVLKLFKYGYDSNSIQKEYHNALEIEKGRFKKAKAYEMLKYGEREGIVYDRIPGKSLLEEVIETGDVERCGVVMGILHKEILQNKGFPLEYYKDFLIQYVDGDNSEKGKRLKKKIDMLPYGNTLCHGDFHPGNIMINGEDVYIIDYMNFCCGHRYYDIGRTVALMEFSELPEGMDGRAEFQRMRREITDVYLREMEVSRDSIEKWIDIILEIRKKEME